MLSSGAGAEFLGQICQAGPLARRQSVAGQEFIAMTPTRAYAPKGQRAGGPLVRGASEVIAWQLEAIAAQGEQCLKRGEVGEAVTWLLSLIHISEPTRPY